MICSNYTKATAERFRFSRYYIPANDSAQKNLRSSSSFAMTGAIKGPLDQTGETVRNSFPVDARLRRRLMIFGRRNRVRPHGLQPALRHSLFRARCGDSRTLTSPASGSPLSLEPSFTDSTDTQTTSSLLVEGLEYRCSKTLATPGGQRRYFVPCGHRLRFEAFLLDLRWYLSTFSLRAVIASSFTERCMALVIYQYVAA